MDNDNSISEASIPIEQEQKPVKPTNSSKIKIFIIAAVAVLLIIWQVGSFFRAVDTSVHDWKITSYQPTCSPDGRFVCLGGEPLGDGTPMTYKIGDLSNDITMTSDMLILERISGSIKPVSHTYSRNSSLAMIMQSAWSQDGLLAYFAGKPRKLCIYDPSNSNFVKKLALTHLLPKPRDSKDHVDRLDVMDWHANNLLCRITTANYRKAEPYNEQYIVVDIDSCKAIDRDK